MSAPVKSPDRGEPGSETGTPLSRWLLFGGLASLIVALLLSLASPVVDGGPFARWTVGGSAVPVGGILAGSVNQIAAAEGDALLAVGTGRLVLASEDGGRSWRNRSPTALEVDRAVTPPKATRAEAGPIRYAAVAEPDSTTDYDPRQQTAPPTGKQGQEAARDDDAEQQLEATGRASDFKAIGSIGPGFLLVSDTFAVSIDESGLSAPRLSSALARGIGRCTINARGRGTIKGFAIAHRDEVPPGITSLGLALAMREQSDNPARTFVCLPGKGENCQYANIDPVQPLQTGWAGTNGNLWLATSNFVWRATQEEAGNGQWTSAWVIDGVIGSPVRDLMFLGDDTTGFLITESDGLFRSDDAGVSWKPVPVAIGGHSFTGGRTVYFVDASRGWIGGEGFLLATGDGGATWAPQRLSADLYRRVTGRQYAGDETAYALPPPAAMGFFLLAFVLVGAGLWRATYRENETRREPEVANAAIPDRAAGPRQPDYTGISRIGKAVADFITNRSTEPSVVFGVYGKWGSGKSSLIRHVSENDNVRYGARQVHFNAWHHQAEANTLGAVLDAIFSQAIGPLTSWRGFTFRLNLLWRRLYAQPFRYALWIGGLIALLIFVLNHITDVSRWLRNAVGLTPDDTTGFSGLAATLLAPQTLAFVTGALGLYGVLNTVSGKLKTYGVDPASLAVSMTAFRTARHDELMKDVGFRYKFASEFKTLTAAFPRPLLIFMDDLDRCTPAQAVEILQIVDFLAISGSCFIVIAADEDWLKISLARQYKDVIDLMFAEEGGFASADVRDRFATNFLEKIIGLAVPVPPLSDASLIRKMALNEAPDDEPPPADEDQTVAWEKWVPRVQLLAALLLAGLVILAGWSLSVMAPNGSLPGSQQQVGQAQSVTPQSPPPESPKAEDTTSGSGADSADAPATSAPAVDRPIARTQLDWVYWLAFAAIATLVAAAVAVAFLQWNLRRRIFIHSDSDAFKAALRDWSPHAFVGLPTPRAVKRFANYARFLWHRQDAVAGRGGERLDSRRLVMLAALHWLSEATDEPLATVASMVRDLPDSPPDEEERALFRRLIAAAPDRPKPAKTLPAR